MIREYQVMFMLDDYVIMEKCLENFIELNIALIKYKKDIIVSEIEKVSNSKVLTYNDKYLNENKSLNHSNKELPANIDDNLKNLIIESAKKIYLDLQMSLIVRIDFLYDRNENQVT